MIFLAQFNDDSFGGLFLWNPLNNLVKIQKKLGEIQWLF